MTYVAKTNIQGPGQGESYKPGDKLRADLTQEEIDDLLLADAIEEAGARDKDEEVDTRSEAEASAEGKQAPAQPRTVTLPETSPAKAGTDTSKAQTSAEKK
jgi:hypothetical protein